MGIAKAIKLFILFISSLMGYLLIGFLLDQLSYFWILTFMGGIVLLLGWFYFKIARPLNDFEASLDRNIENDSSSELLLESIADDIVFKSKIKDLIEKYSSLMIRENSVEMLDKQAELAALQSRINPHFLYNTLESIRGYALIYNDNDVAKMVESLAVFFRYSINRKADLVTLRDEIANIQNYMMILKFRFNNRFLLEIMIDDEDIKVYDYFIPKLILQPIVENAIYHGLEDCVEGGKVTIEVVETEKNLLITISDNGKGMDSNTLRELNQRILFEDQYSDGRKDHNQRNTGIALPNINKRIKLLFGENSGLTVYSNLNQGTDVEITIPAHYEGKKIKHEEGNTSHQQSESRI